MSSTASRPCSCSACWTAERSRTTSSPRSRRCSARRGDSMAFVAWANLYICANVLLASSAALVAVLDFASHRLERPLAYRHCLRLAHVLAVAAVLLAFVPPLVRYDGLVRPRPPPMWASPTVRGVGRGGAAGGRGVRGGQP